jgi:hypothetical protein
VAGAPGWLVALAVAFVAAWVMVVILMAGTPA